MSFHHQATLLMILEVDKDEDMVEIEVDCSVNCVIS